MNSDELATLHNLRIIEEFFNQSFAEVEWEENHSMRISHLTDKGVADLKKHVFKQEVTE